jgi:YVTN family beta-propeller protein
MRESPNLAAASRTAAPGCRFIAWLTALAAALVLCTSAMAAGKALKKIGSIELPGPAGKDFGALAIDAARHLLFVAHLGAGKLYVIDLATEQVIKTVDALPGPDGIVCATGERKIFVSDRGDDSVAVLDARTYQVLNRIPTQSLPSGLAYASGFQQVYVSDAGAQSEAVLDANRDVSLGSASLGSDPGQPAFDPVAKKIYINLPQKNQIAEVDPPSGRLSALFALGRCLTNTEIALDANQRRGFLSCAGNNLLAVVDLQKMAPITFLRTKPGAAAVAWDAAWRRIYVVCASGWISVFEEKDVTHYRHIADADAAYAVRGLAVDPQTHRLYTVEKEEDGMPVARVAVYAAQR